MGRHQLISDAPYVFSRTLQDEKFEDKVVIALDLPEQGSKHLISVGAVYKDGTKLINHYTGEKLRVKNGAVRIQGNSKIALLTPH